MERITFLATFPQTEYRTQLDPKKSTTRKNEVLAKALKEKGNKSYASGDNIEAMNHYNQALRFANIEQQVVLLGDKVNDCGRVSCWPTDPRYGLSLENLTGLKKMLVLLWRQVGRTTLKQQLIRNPICYPQGIQRN